MTVDHEAAFYKKRLLLSISIPGFFLLLMWVIFAADQLPGVDLRGIGIYPLTIKGLPGILLSPFVHADIRHLFNNSIPLLVLGTALFYFYGEVSLKVFLLNWIFTGSMVWLSGRESWHIGASGLVYGMVFFIFFSGLIRRHFRLMALSLLVVFLYGSMVWGMFPIVPVNISWESHMLGAVSGIFLAVWYQNEGPQAPVYEWLDEEDDDMEDNEVGDNIEGEEKEQSPGS
jgi:membrane associated rhomboid family serine protease